MQAIIHAFGTENQKRQKALAIQLFSSAMLTIFVIFGAIACSSDDDDGLTDSDAPTDGDQSPIVTDHEFPTTDGDTTPDGDSEEGDLDVSETESDVDQDLEFADGDLDGEQSETFEYENEYSDFAPDGDFEWEIPGGDEDPTDIGEQAADELVLPFDNREVMELTPFCAWTYQVENAAESRAGQVATAVCLSDPLGSDELYRHDGENALANPPLRSSFALANENMGWAVYRPFNADGRIDHDSQVVFRREEKLNTGKIEVAYFSADIPAIDNCRFVQTAALPVQSDEKDDQVDFLAAYVWEYDDENAYLVTRPYRAITGPENDASITALADPTYITLNYGFRQASQVRIVNHANQVWLNAGDSLHALSSSGEYLNSHRLNLILDDDSRFDLIDFAISSDGVYISTLTQVEFTNGSLETVWTLQPAATPHQVTKLWRFGYEYNAYRTAFSADSRYAMVANGDPNTYDDLYVIDLDRSPLSVQATNQPVWGRPLSFDDPSRLLLAFPISSDLFRSVDLRIDSVAFSTLLDRSFNLE